MRRNSDLSVTIGPPAPSDEKYTLYGAYLRDRHDGQMDGSPQEFHDFLYTSDVDTLEVSCRLGERLLSVTIVDVEPEAMSAVYCYFDPTESGRSLGVFSVLWLLDACRRARRRHLYLGYWVAGSHKMSYKALYRPHQILSGPGEWARGVQDMGQ